MQQFRDMTHLISSDDKSVLWRGSQTFITFIALEQLWSQGSEGSKAMQYIFSVCQVNRDYRLKMLVEVPVPFFCQSQTQLAFCDQWGGRRWIWDWVFIRGHSPGIITDQITNWGIKCISPISRHPPYQSSGFLALSSHQEKVVTSLFPLIF